MNVSHLVASSKLRIVLPLVAAAALLVLFSLSATTSAGSPSGGVGMEVDKKEGRVAKVNARYRRLWSKVKRSNKRWARSTARCESGGDPKAIGGGGAYRGAFQFLRSTWKRAPKSPGGDPIRYAYTTQAVVAVALKKKVGRSPWPVCG